MANNEDEIRRLSKEAATAVLEYVSHAPTRRKARRLLTLLNVPERLAPGRYRSPDGVVGVLRAFDELANHYSFEPDGFKPPAVIGPGLPSGRITFGENDTEGWTYIGILGLPRAFLKPI